MYAGFEIKVLFNNITVLLQLKSWNYGHNKMSIARKISKILKNSFG